MRVLIAAGGTGGHIYPGIAIAKKIQKEHPEVQITFVGTHKGLEKDLIPKEGFPLKIIRVKGFKRKLSLDTFQSIKTLFLGLNDAKQVIKKMKPDIVIGTGGYVCGPILFMARIQRVPTLIHEQNAFPGVTNKILSRFVDKIAISFSESEKYFKVPDKLVLAGNPIREEFKYNGKELARKKLNIPGDYWVIAVSGGSQGALSINKSMIHVIKALKERDNVMVIHITGRNQHQEVLHLLKDEDVQLEQYPNIQVLPYSYDVADIYQAADIIVSRSGAMTISEITAVGRPSILIPFPYATDNHQEFNAKVITDKHGGIMIKDCNLNGQLLLTTIEDMLSDPVKMKKMEEATSNLGILNADDILYNEIINLMNVN
ncbi:MAG: undecaprenyldiphospho-muramoylpentapeptide beta-N-acetylglucosaminyltransferase [Eubacteriales bacterium]